MAIIINQIFDFLKAQGLQPEKESYGISFLYQMADFVILEDKEDDRFFRIIMPNLMAVDENNRTDVLEACNRVTKDVKLVKAYIVDGEGSGTVWLSTEQLLDKDPRFEDIIPRSLRTLLAAHRIFEQTINE